MKENSYDSPVHTASEKSCQPSRQSAAAEGHHNTFHIISPIIIQPPQSSQPPSKDYGEEFGNPIQTPLFT